MNVHRQYTGFIAQLLSYLFCAAVLHASRYLIWLPLWGHNSAAITGFAAIAPVVATYTGTWFILSQYCLKLLLNTPNLESLSPIIARQLPSFIACKVFNTRAWWWQVVPCLVALVVFNCYWFGTVAMVYSILWLLPLALFFLGLNNMLARALYASFNAHAVGTIVWLFTDSLTASQWCALTPIACLERLIIAGGILIAAVIADYVLHKVQSMIRLSLRIGNA